MNIFECVVYVVHTQHIPHLSVANFWFPKQLLRKKWNSRLAGAKAEIWPPPQRHLLWLIQGAKCRPQPSTDWSTCTNSGLQRTKPSRKEIQEVIKMARPSLSPDPSGVYKISPKLRHRLSKILKIIWRGVNFVLWQFTDWVNRPLIISEHLHWHLGPEMSDLDGTGVSG